MEKFDEKEGRWITFRGRKIFIRSGESLGNAMSRSGKFKREDIRETKGGISQVDRFNKAEKGNLSQRRKAINKMRSKDTRYSNSVYTTNRQAEKNRINENAPINKEAKTRVERNKERYSETDRRELRREELQKKLRNYNFAKAQDDYEKLQKEMEKDFDEGNYTEYGRKNQLLKETVNRWDKARIDANIDSQAKQDKVIADYKAKKQSNNKLNNEYTRQELKDKYGTDDVELINAGKEKENRVKLIDEKQSNKNNYDRKTPEQAKAELGWGHHNLTNEKAIEEKFGKQSNNKYKVKKYGDTYIALKNGHNEGEFATEDEAKDFLSKIQNNKNETIKNYVEKKKSNNKIDNNVAKKFNNLNDVENNRKNVKNTKNLLKEIYGEKKEPKKDKTYYELEALYNQIEQHIKDLKKKKK